MVATLCVPKLAYSGQKERLFFCVHLLIRLVTNPPQYQHSLMDSSGIDRGIRQAGTEARGKLRGRQT